MDWKKRILARGGGPVGMAELSLPEGLRMLVLAPHPDDFDAIGVTLKYLFGKVNAVHTGVARTGSGVQDGYRPGLSLADKAKLREREQRDSLQFFGLPEDNLSFLDLVNGDDDQPLDCPENTAMIEALVGAKAPEMVFLPHGNDTNRGHRVMYSLFSRVAQQPGRSLAAFLNRDPKTIDLRTDVYMPFGRDEADWKARLLRFHDSQHQRNLRTRGHGFDDRILEVNRSIARELSLGCEFAEAFEVELYHTTPR